MNPHDWASYYLLVSFNIGRDPISMLLDHASQEEFFTAARQHTRMPNNVSVLRITEDVFELLESTYRDSGYLVEGGS